MIDPNHCLIYRTTNNEIIWYEDLETLIQQRDRLIDEMNKSVNQLYVECDMITRTGIKLAYSKCSKWLLADLNEKGQQVSYINAKLDCRPLTSDNPTFREAENLLSEKDYLSIKLQSIEKAINDYHSVIAVLNQRIGSFRMPGSESIQVLKLAEERNLRIQMIANATSLQIDLAHKKASYQNQQIQKENIKLIFDTLNTEINNCCYIVNLNRSAIRTIDNQIRSLDPAFLWNLMQVDEDVIMNYCKREMHEKRIEKLMNDINKIKTRIRFINYKFMEFNNINGHTKNVNEFNTSNFCPQSSRIQSSNGVNLNASSNVIPGANFNVMNSIDRRPQNFRDVSNINLPQNSDLNLNLMSILQMQNQNDANNAPLDNRQIQNQIHTIIRHGILEANSKNNLKSLDKMNSNAERPLPSNVSSFSIKTNDLLDSLGSNGISPNSSQNDSDNTNKNSPTHLSNGVDSDHTEETTDDFLLKDLNKEIEKAIHQVEKIVIQTDDQIDN